MRAVFAHWPVLAASALAGGIAAATGTPLAAGLAALAAGCGAWALRPSRGTERSGLRTVMLALSPELMARRREQIHHELGVLEDAQDLQRGVFEVSAELVGCIDEADARLRFAAAMRRYWSSDAADLLVWERGSWRSLGGLAVGEPPWLAAPVQLPPAEGGDLVLDLSPAVDGRAALVLRQARAQPSLAGRSLQDQRYVAEVLRGQLSLSLRRVILYASLQLLARQDPLTGTHRRWYGESRLKELVEAGEVLSAAMVDVDFFKRVNDEHGHAGGDQVLAAVGRTLARMLRAGDLVCRWGGEEFLIILPETSPDGARLAAERIRAAIAAIPDLPVSVTVSVGVASCWQDEPPEALVARADEALYLAKRNGRNRVESAQGPAAGDSLRTTARRRRVYHSRVAE
jgi:diguanylate cyclase (GGDEF)-like protein